LLFDGGQHHRLGRLSILPACSLPYNAAAAATAVLLPLLATINARQIDVATQVMWTVDHASCGL